MYAVTGATGKLGRLVISALLKRVPATTIVAAARNPSKAADLAAQGVVVREADYNRPETLGKALTGVEKVLLISGGEVGRRVAQHKAIIDAASSAGVELIAYTSILHAEVSPIGLAEDHRQTEALLRASGIPHVLLRNGWYTENYTGSIPTILAHGVRLGCAGEGRVSTASRADYAEAGAVVLASSGNLSGRIYELAGDSAFTLAEFAAELSHQAGKPIAYRNVPEADYRAALVSAGLPEPVAAMLAQSEACIAKGALFDESHDLSRLIGRPTTALKDAIATSLR